MCDGGCFNECTCVIESTVGDDGDPATISIGTVTTGNPGTSANVVNAGTPTNAILNFTIPQGPQGPSGTYTRGVINGTASTVLTEAQSGSLVLFNNSEGPLMTLPTAPAIGTFFVFEFATTITGAAARVLAVSSTMRGYLIAKKSATADVFFYPNGTTDNEVSMNGTTTGGIIGTQFTVTYIGANKWDVAGYTLGSGALATQFTTV